MAETSTTVQTATPPGQAAGGSQPESGASKSGITFISKNGQPVNNNPQGTPDPEGEAGNSNAPTNADAGGEKNDANTQAPATEGAEGGAPQGEGSQPPAETSPDLLALLADRSGGQISKPEDALALVDEVTQLRTQIAERPQIEFPNDEAKQIYEFALKFPGMGMPAARNFLHVQSLDVNKLDPKEVQFEAFALKKPHWTREQARSYFEEKFERDYGSGQLDTSSMAKLDYEDATRAAREELIKVQQDFAAAKPSQQAGEQQTPQLSPEQQAQLQRQVEEVTKGFGGVRYQFIENDANSTVNIQMEKAELQKFQRYLMDPSEFLRDLAAECTENGVFSQAKYRDAMFEFVNRKKIRDQVFNQGKVYGEVTFVKERKNTAAPKAPNGAPPPARPQTFQEAMRAAVKGNQLKV